MHRTLALYLLTLATQAAASPLFTCADLRGFLADPSVPIQGADRCFTAMGLSGKTHHCTWSYPFRAPEASAAFTATAAELEACQSGTATPDIGVNHPDTYTLLEFEVDGAGVTLSLKDKGALGQSLVFLGVVGLKDLLR